jgi:hypothetical protein
MIAHLDALNELSHWRSGCVFRIHQLSVVKKCWQGNSGAIDNSCTPPSHEDKPWLRMQRVLLYI